MKDVITKLPLFGRSLSEKPPLLTGLVVLLSVLLAAGLGGPLRAAAAGPPIEYVVNGGFESGDFSGWNVASYGSFPAVQGEKVNTGAHAAHMGDLDWEGAGEEGCATIIEQEVTLPSGAESLILEFDYLVDNTDYDAGPGEYYDYLQVFINAQEIFFTYEYSDGWQAFHFDLLDELDGDIGDTITLSVRCWTIDEISIVNYYVDNFSLEADGVELIENGGFETGDFSGWNVTVSGLFPVVQGDQVPDSGGNYAAHMGDGGVGMLPSQATAITQEISLPTGAEDPLLQLAYLVEFAEGYDDYEFDGNEWTWLEILIDDQQILYACSHSDGWQEHEFDLSDYIGKTFTLTVRVVLDVVAMYDWAYENEADLFPIDFYVDDISVTASEAEPEEPEPEEPSEPEEPPEPPEDQLPQTGGTLPLGGLLALGLISGGAALLGLRRKLSR